MMALGSNDRLLLCESPAVIGVDEVGRGALAGPVVVCATRFESIPEDEGVKDSKLLSRLQREAAAERLLAGHVSWVVCEVGWLPQLLLMRPVATAASGTEAGPSRLASRTWSVIQANSCEARCWKM